MLSYFIHNKYELWGKIKDKNSVALPVFYLKNENDDWNHILPIYSHISLEKAKPLRFA